MHIKNIIFDLGGVIIDIDYKLTAHAFGKLGTRNFDEIYSQSQQTSLFDDFETGKISDDIFRSRLLSKLDIEASDDEFDNAWNAMLLDLPKQRLEFIKQLKYEYKVFLFSNTNTIHLKRVFDICNENNGFNNFSEYFDKEYYSHIFGHRKPHCDSFLKLLSDSNLIADETLFIDDSLQHVLGAKQAGIHAIHLTKEYSIFDTLEFIKQINIKYAASSDEPAIISSYGL